MKDYYDLWLISDTFDFDGTSLQKAIEATFNNRDTEIPDERPSSLSADFASRKSNPLEKFPEQDRDWITRKVEDFESVLEAIWIFLEHPVQSSFNQNKVNMANESLVIYSMNKVGRIVPPATNRSCATSRSASTTAPRSACSVSTARANPPCCASWQASTKTTSARSRKPKATPTATARAGTQTRRNQNRHRVRQRSGAAHRRYARALR
jgi:hypothetical protein